MAAMTIPDLEARVDSIKRRVQEIDQEYEGQALPEEARVEWNSLNEERDETNKLIEELQARSVVIEGLASGVASREDGMHQIQTSRPGVVKGDDIYDLSTIRASFDNPDAQRTEVRDRAKRAIERATFPHPKIGATGHVNREDCQTHVERLIHRTQETTPGEVARHILQTGSETYRTAFWKQKIGAQLNSAEQRALSLAQPGGGSAVPFTLDPTIIPTSNSVVNPTRALARVETISGSNTWNGVSSGAITATYQAEAAATTDNTPTLAAPTATVQMARAFVPFSLEVQQDWGAMEAEMSKLFQDSKDDLEGVQFVTGAGTTVFPQGFVTGTTTTVGAASGLTVTAANLYALEAALPARFRPNESFVANRGIYNVLRGIDTAGGAALWLYMAQGLVTQSPTPGNTGATLLGRGAWEASGMQATVVNATKIMVVGDFDYFLIVDRIGMQVEVVPHLFGSGQGNQPTGQRGLFAYWRNMSKVLSASAFVALTGTT